jgi:hypothetical protein
MVMLLRAAGIEARNVTGFLGGSWSDLGNYLAVTQNEAHSWVEVWFPAYGWVPFDPTPAGSGAAGASSPWMWPGRYLADALQHRWGKWVLDYSLQNQVDVLGRAARALSAERLPGGPGRGETALLPMLIMTSLLAAGAFLLASRRPARGSPETRIYLQLVESCRRTGLVSGPVAPLELLEVVRRFGGSAGAPASRLVGLYLRARFAGEALGDTERAEMTAALRGARRGLSERRRELEALRA